MSPSESPCNRPHDLCKLAYYLPFHTPMSNRERNLPYWISGGTEICEGCSMPYVLQMEYRCDGCDRALCEQCFIVVNRTRDRVIVGCRACEASEGTR